VKIPGAIAPPRICQEGLNIAQVRVPLDLPLVIIYRGNWNLGMTASQL